MRRIAACSAVLVASVIMLACSSLAHAEAPWWHAQASFLPSALIPGGKGQMVVTVGNFGDASAIGITAPVTITDSLPAGVTATGITEIKAGMIGNRGELTCDEAFPATSVSCTWSGRDEPGSPLFEALQPYEPLVITLGVEFSKASASEENEVRVSGGEGFACKETDAGFGKFTGPTCGPPEERESGGNFVTEPTGQAVPPISRRQVVPVSSAEPPFGAEGYTISAEAEGGAADTQAGSHPYQLTTSFALNQGAAYDKPIALVKDLHFDLPAGLIGDPTAIPQCSEVEFSTIVTGGYSANLCPNESAVGVALVTIVLHGNETPSTLTVPVFNLTPQRGEPARFGFEFFHATVTIDTEVRSGGDYGVVLNVENISQLAALVSSQVTVWGTPGLQSHDKSRGWSCQDGGEINLFSGGQLGPCVGTNDAEPPPFLRMPTSCSGPLVNTVTGDSWPLGEPKQALPLLGAKEASLPGMDGCASVPFAPEISFEPDVHAASSPTGATVKVRVPQEASLNPDGQAPADIKDTEVALPEGVTLNPAAANGLEACSEGLAGFTGFEELNKPFEPGVQTPIFTAKLPEPLQPGVNFCPAASKVGTVTIKTPPLANPLQGAVYLADQTENPFGSFVAMYIVVEDPVSGVQARLAGEVALEEQRAGQVVAKFQNTPQVPLEELEMQLFEGELVTPAHCGTYTTSALFTPWSRPGVPVSASSGFQITSGPSGGACPGQLPFAPSLTSGTTDTEAAAFSQLTTTISREDGNQALSTVTLHLPPGLAGSLADVKLCPEAQASAGTCGPESLVGHTTVIVGVGKDPYAVTGGQVFLTGEYERAPFGLSITSPAKAGPFDLAAGSPCDCVVVRAKVQVDPHTAAVTVTSGSIPHSLQGIPLQIRQVNATLDRTDFTFNPSNCDPLSIPWEITGTEGALVTQAAPFQVVNCAKLNFAPKLMASTAAHTSKALGASLTTKVTYPSALPGTQVNIARVKVDLPKQLPSELKTLQKACLAAVFEANPANCPAQSIVGHAVVHTPVLPVPLTGSAYLVSHGGEAFPSLTMVLQGYGITIDLVGSTHIRKGITSTTFQTVPDVPFSSFELTLPQSKFPALAANLPVKAKGSFCGQKMDMLVAFVAQDGAEFHQAAPIGVTGCPVHKKARAKRGSIVHRKRR